MPSAASPLPCFGAAYIRVSTDDQAELSPETQLEEIRKYAQREGIILLQEQIYIDSGISGKKAERRPEFMRMIATAKEKDCPFSVILLWKYSRFARNQEESIFYKSILRSKCGVDVVSVTEPLIAGPFGSLIERIIEWMDEFYSIRLSQEVKRSMLVNAQRGKLQATPSFGYRVEDGRLIPVEEEAQLIRRIFDSFVAGKGLFPIAKELNDLGIRTHRGNRFENRTVEYILRNPVYIGKLRWNPAGRTRRDFFNENLIIADAEHEPLISLDTWDAAQRRLDEVKVQWGYKARPASELKSWLSGLLWSAVPPVEPPLFLQSPITTNAITMPGAAVRIPSISALICWRRRSSPSWKRMPRPPRDLAMKSPTPRHAAAAIWQGWRLRSGRYRQRRPAFRRRTCPVF